MYMDNFAKTRLSRRYATLERGENLAKNPWYKEPKYMVGMVVVPLLVAIIMIAPGILFPQPTSPRAINDSPIMKLDNNINVSPIINNNNQNIITIEVLVRDKNHAGTSGSDDHKPASFTISSPEPIYEMQTSLNLPQAQQPNQTKSIVAPIIESGTINISGKGEGVSQEFILANGLAIFTMNYLGSNNFIVDLMNSDGTNKRLIANQIGKFNGAKALGISTTGDYKLYLSNAPGPWTVNITQPKFQTAQNVPVSFSGMDQQVQFFKLRPGLATFKLSYSGYSQFHVTLLDLKGNVVNDMGYEFGIITNTSKTIDIKDDGIYCLDIATIGDWKIDINQ